MVTVFTAGKSNSSLHGQLFIFVCINISDGLNDSFISLFSLRLSSCKKLTYIIDIHTKKALFLHAPGALLFVAVGKKSVVLEAVVLLWLQRLPEGSSCKAQCFRSLFRPLIGLLAHKRAVLPLWLTALKHTHRREVCGTVGLLRHVCAM